VTLRVVHLLQVSVPVALAAVAAALEPHSKRVDLRLRGLERANDGRGAIEDRDGVPYRYGSEQRRYRPDFIV